MTWMIIILIALLLLPASSEHRKMTRPLVPIEELEPVDDIVIVEDIIDEPIEQVQDEKKGRRLLPRLLRKTRKH